MWDNGHSLRGANSKRVNGHTALEVLLVLCRVLFASLGVMLSELNPLGLSRT